MIKRRIINSGFIITFKVFFLSFSKNILWKPNIDFLLLLQNYFAVTLIEWEIKIVWLVNKKIKLKIRNNLKIYKTHYIYLFLYLFLLIVSFLLYFFPSNISHFILFLTYYYLFILFSSILFFLSLYINRKYISWEFPQFNG